MGLQPFDAIVEAHHPEIYRYLRRLTTWSSEADDLSQETFLRAYRAHASLGPDTNIRAWLFTVATNLARNHFRSEGRRRRAHAAVKAESVATDGSGPDGEMVLSEVRERLDGIVTGLPVKQRAAFVLRKVHDLDYDAIGRSLDCSPESARAHVFHALKKIRRALTEQGLAPVEPEP